VIPHWVYYSRVALDLGTLLNINLAEKKSQFKDMVGGDE
jgi:hypothetical protein